MSILGSMERRRWRRSVLLSICLAALGSGSDLATAPASAEITVGAYLGKSMTEDADVELVSDHGTDLRFTGVTWDDESFVGPIYYGAKLTYWLKSSPRWGIGGDFTHAKMVANLDSEVFVEGWRNGDAVSGTESLGDTFENLSFTHGYNTLTLTGSHRWFLGADGPGTAGSRWRPYVGGGVGIAIPHVQVTMDSVETYEYQLVGPAAQGFGGGELSVSRHLSLFAEYKLSWAEMRPDLIDGAQLEVQPWTHHVVLGALFSF